MKKYLVVVTGLVAALTLAGCANNQAATKKTNSQATSKSSKVSRTPTRHRTSHKEVSQTSRKTTSNSTSSKATSSAQVWNETKAQKLRDFMTSWEQTMKQSYESYSPGNNVSLYGAEFPDYLTKNLTAVGETHVSAAWSNDGAGAADYNVVAVYSNADNAGYGAEILYLFTIHDGQPVVLVTKQNQGMPDGNIHFNATENTALQAGFAEVIGDGSSSTNGSSTSANQSTGGIAKVSFDKSLWGTWYGYDESNQTIETMIIQDNKLTSDGKVIEAYDGNKRSDIDTTAGASVDPQKEDWIVLRIDHVAGRTWTNLMGWYQGAGAGTYYSVKQRDIEDQSTLVLSVADGSWDMRHYYPTRAMAEQMKAQTFTDEDKDNLD